jgi:hypothetical protein
MVVVALKILSVMALLLYAVVFFSVGLPSTNAGTATRCIWKCCVDPLDDVFCKRVFFAASLRVVG